MNDTLLNRTALALTVIGLATLFLFSWNAQPKQVPLKELGSFTGKEVIASGRVSSITPKQKYFTLSDNTTSVRCYNKANLRVEEKQSIKVKAIVRETSGQTLLTVEGLSNE